jgi:outer membrane protein TolC
MKTKYWLFIICCLSFAILQAQTISLDEVLNKIEQNNLSLLSYQNKIKADDELVNGANAWMPPKLSTEWDDIPYKFDSRKSQLRISVAQDFPNPKKIEAKEDYLKSISSIEKNDGEYHKVELFVEAKEAYYKRYISEHRIKVLEESNNIMEIMIRLSEKQMAIGKGEMASVYRLKARLTENQTMVVHEQNMIRSETATLNYLMNEDINKTFDIDTNNLVKNYRALKSDMKMDSLDCKRSDIMRMNSQINSMKLNQSVLALESKPIFGMRLENYTKFGGRPDAYSIMGTMTIPIAPWSSRGYKSQVKSMGFTVDAMEQNKQNMINMAKQMIKMYLIELESEYKELDNYTTLVIPAYKKSLDASLLSYGQNTNDLNMTLMTWDDLQMAQMEYLKHLDTYFNIQAQYEKEVQIR